MPNNSTLPIETLDTIIQELISALPEGTEDDSFLPRRQWKIAPLLYVCKIWRAVSERQMYRVISVGKTIAFATKDKALMMRRAEKGYRIAMKLMDTLRAHPRLASNVEALELATMKGKDWGHEVEWTHVNTHIIQLCPNLKRLNNLGNYDSYPNPALKNLTTVLKEKSLVSFCLTQDGVLGNASVAQLNLYDILPTWPKLQAINLSKCHLSEAPSRAPLLCCPELHEVMVVDCKPLGHHYDLLRNTTVRVTKFYISSNITYIRDREPFYRCLRAWSTTLTHLRICVDVFDRYGVENADYSPLWAVVSTMTELRELQVYAELARTSQTSALELSFILRLSKLERLCLAPWNFKWSDIEAVEIPPHLPALRHIICCSGYYESEFGSDIVLFCWKRNIKLEKWKHWMYAKIPGFVL